MATGQKTVKLVQKLYPPSDSDLTNSITKTTFATQVTPDSTNSITTNVVDRSILETTAEFIIPEIRHLAETGMTVNVIDPEVTTSDTITDNTIDTVNRDQDQGHKTGL